MVYYLTGLTKEESHGDDEEEGAEGEEADDAQGPA
jgi:hypothetical protein